MGAPDFSKTLLPALGYMALCTVGIGFIALLLFYKP